VLSAPPVASKQETKNGEHRPIKPEDGKQVILSEGGAKHYGELLKLCGGG